MICEQLRRGAGLRIKNRVHQPILVCVIELRPFAPAVPEQLGLQIVVPPNIIVHLLLGQACRCKRARASDPERLA